MKTLSDVFYVVYDALELIIDAKALEPQGFFALDYVSIGLSAALVDRVVAFGDKFELLSMQESQVAHIFLG